MSKTIMLTLGALALATVPLTSALDVNDTLDANPCAQDGRTGNTIFALGFAFGINWSPECITVDDGDVVAWQSIDAEPVHAPRFSGRNGCWDGQGALVAPTDIDSVSLAWDGSALSGHISSARATGAVAEIDFVCDPADPLTHGITVVEDENGRGFVRILYECILHGDGMLGEIRLKL